MADTKNGNTGQIWVAIIGLVGAPGVAVIGNSDKIAIALDKLIRSNPPASTSEQTTKSNPPISSPVQSTKDGPAASNPAPPTKSKPPAPSPVSSTNTNPPPESLGPLAKSNLPSSASTGSSPVSDPQPKPAGLKPGLKLKPSGETSTSEAPPTTSNLGQLTGWITDSRCSVKGANAGHLQCATKCLKSDADLVFVIDQSQRVLKIGNSVTMGTFVGQHVAVTGPINADSIYVQNARAQ